MPTEDGLYPSRRHFIRGLLDFSPLIQRDSPLGNVIFEVFPHASVGDNLVKVYPLKNFP